MTQNIYATIATKIDIQVSYVPLQRMHTLVSGKYGYQKFQRLTHKDPMLCRYQKSMLELCL